MIRALIEVLRLLTSILWWTAPTPEETARREMRERLRRAQPIARETGFSVFEVDVALQLGATRESLLELRRRNQRPY